MKKFNEQGVITGINYENKNTNLKEHYNKCFHEIDTNISVFASIMMLRPKTKEKTRKNLSHFIKDCCELYETDMLFHQAMQNYIKEVDKYNLKLEDEQ
jgi:hypothetical protein